MGFTNKDHIITLLSEIQSLPAVVTISKFTGSSVSRTIKIAKRNQHREYIKHIAIQIFLMGNELNSNLIYHHNYKTLHSCDKKCTHLKIRGSLIFILLF